MLTQKRQRMFASKKNAVAIDCHSTAPSSRSRTSMVPVNAIPALLTRTERPPITRRAVSMASRPLHRHVVACGKRHGAADFCIDRGCALLHVFYNPIGQQHDRAMARQTSCGAGADAAACARNERLLASHTCAPPQPYCRRLVLSSDHVPSGLH